MDPKQLILVDVVIMVVGIVVMELYSLAFGIVLISFGVLLVMIHFLFVYSDEWRGFKSSMSKLHEKIKALHSALEIHKSHLITKNMVVLPFSFEKLKELTNLPKIFDDTCPIADAPRFFGGFRFTPRPISLANKHLNFLHNYNAVGLMIIGNDFRRYYVEGECPAMTKFDSPVPNDGVITLYCVRVCEYKYSDVICFLDIQVNEERREIGDKNKGRSILESQIGRRVKILQVGSSEFLDSIKVEYVSTIEIV